jgi:2-dehydropantoate 2-reductase
MRTLIIGAGGVGGYLAARLESGRADVTILARGAHGEALRAHGLRILGGANEERVRLAHVVTDAEELRDGKRFDLIVLAVKWSDLESACDALPNLIAPGGVVVPLLNGLSSEDVVMRYVGAQRTIAGVIYMSAGLREPGSIYVNGRVRLGLAAYRPGQDEDIARIGTLFEAAGVPLQRSDDYHTMLWQKMIWNAPFNGLCALSGRNAGYCVEHMELLVRRAMREVIAVARADGAALSEQLVDVMIEITRGDYALTEPSMLQDVRRGRSTEVEILQAEVVRRGLRLGVDTPVLSTLAAILTARPTEA